MNEADAKALVSTLSDAERTALLQQAVLEKVAIIESPNFIYHSAGAEELPGLNLAISRLQP